MRVIIIYTYQMQTSGGYEMRKTSSSAFFSCWSYVSVSPIYFFIGKYDRFQDIRSSYKYGIEPLGHTGYEHETSLF
jgi:hypothetical protein